MNPISYSVPKKATFSDIVRAIKSILAVAYNVDRWRFLGLCFFVFTGPFTASFTVYSTNKLIASLTEKSQDQIILWSSLFITSIVVIYSVNYLQTRLRTRLAVTSNHYFDEISMTRLSNLPMTVIEHPEFRKLHASYVRESRTANSMIAQIINFFGNSTKLVGWVSVLFIVPPITAVMTFIGLLAYCFVAYKGFKGEAEIQEIKSDTALRVDYYNNRLRLVTLQATLRANHLIKPFLDSWSKLSLSIRRQIIEKRIAVRTHNYVADLFEPLALGLGLFALIPSVLNGTIQPSIAITFISILPRLWDQISSLMNSVSDLASSIPFMLIYNTFYSIPREKTGNNNIANRPLKVTFEAVTFRYQGSETNVLQDLSFSFEMGDQLALIGLNGAGKSTLLKLLVGLYHPTSGRILVNGADLKDIDPDQWRKQLSYMDQSVPHFDDTLREQIHYGDYSKPLDKKRLALAIHTSGLDEILDELPQGLETHAGRQYATKEAHPIELSGGQDQILTIARTIYRPAKLYIFDEPTSAVDAIKEERFFNRLPSALEGKTTLFISHRFSTVRRAKRIIVLSSGSIVEDGSHDELIKEDGLYAQLFNLQAKAYSQDG